MIIQELIAAKVAQMTSNGDTFSFLHSNKDWQNLETDEELLPAVHLDAPAKGKPVPVMGGAVEDRQICSVMFMYESNLDDNPNQQYNTLKLAHSAMYNFIQLVLQDSDNFDTSKTTWGEYAQIEAYPLFDRCVDVIILPFTCVPRNRPNVCIPSYATPISDCEAASYLVQFENLTLIEAGTVASGGSVTVNVPLPECSGTSSVTSTGQTGDPNGSYWNLPTGKVNVWGHNFRWCGITGGYTDGVDYFDVNGATTTRALAYPEGLLCDLRHVDCDGNFPMYGMDGISTTGYDIYSVVDAYNTSYSTASFLNGFRTPTINELDSCIYFPTQYTYSQKPFQKSQAQWWSDTDATAGNKWIVINTPVRTPVPNSGASGMSFPVRTTNISELS